MLQVTDSGRKDETVACADRLDNTAHTVLLASAQVRLVDSVEFTATARDLKRPLECISMIRDPMYFVVFCVSLDVTGVSQVFHEVGPSRSKFWILYLAILHPELEISVNGDKLCIYPTERNLVTVR
jgi:hypothetical protein